MNTENLLDALAEALQARQELVEKRDNLVKGGNLKGIDLFYALEYERAVYVKEAMRFETELQKWLQNELDKKSVS